MVKCICFCFKMFCWQKQTSYSGREKKKQAKNYIAHVWCSGMDYVIVWKKFKKELKNLHMFLFIGIFMTFEDVQGML